MVVLAQIKHLMSILFVVKQKTAYEIYQCDGSSDVCSSDLGGRAGCSCPSRRCPRRRRACPDRDSAGGRRRRGGRVPASLFRPPVGEARRSAGVSSCPFFSAGVGGGAAEGARRARPAPAAGDSSSTAHAPAFSSG